MPLKTLAHLGGNHISPQLKH